MTWSGDRPPAEGEPAGGDAPKPYFPPPAVPLPPGAWGPPEQTWQPGPAQPGFAPPPSGSGWGPSAGAGWGPPTGGPPGFPELPPHLKPKTTRTIVFAVIGVLAVVAIGFGGLVAYFVTTTNPSNAQVGDCIDFTVEKAPKAGELFGEAVAEKIACAERSAAYKVGVRLDNPTAPCPGEAYASYFQKGGPFGKFKLCLIPNVTEGDCFLESPTKTDVFPCSEGRRRDAIKVLRIVQGVADERRCQDLGDRDVYAVTYSTPATTICFQPFGGSSSGPGRNT